MGLFGQNLAKHEQSLVKPTKYLHTFKPFTYIHIPKSAGTSVYRSGLIPLIHQQGHNTAREIDNLDQFYSFTFIRNPYDKVYSSYNYFLNGKHGEDNKRKWLKENYPTFEKFILDYNKSKKIDKFHFELTQKYYVTNEKGDIIVDYIGNFYDVNKEFLKVQKLNPVYYNDVITLPLENKSHKPIIKITDEMASIIYNHWKEDFIFFNINKNSYK